MSKIDIFKNLITFASPHHLGLKGGVKAQHDFLLSAADELRMFLQGYKGQHISVDELQGFYAEHFPLMKLKILNKTPKGNAVGVAKANIAEDSSKITDFQITITSKSLMDKIKMLLNIDNTKKDFYVNADFVEFMTHEGTHIL